MTVQEISERGNVNSPISSVTSPLNQNEKKQKLYSPPPSKTLSE